MTRILLSLILGILPQALYFMLFLTKTKEIKSKRILLTILFYIIIALMVMITRYNLYLYLLIIPLIYGAMKLLYKRKAQIIDIFLIASGFGYMIIISYLCSFIYKNNYNLYWIAYAINNILLFSIFAFMNRLKALYRKYIKVWNRNPNNKVRSISVRNVSLLLLNAFIFILDVFIIKISS